MLTSMPACRDSATRSGTSTSVGCGRRSSSGSSPSTPITSRRSCEGEVRLLAHDAGGRGELVGGRVRTELEGAGVHAQQRQTMAEDVVHLPGDAGALVVASGDEPVVLLGRSAGGARRDELAAGADEHAPPGDRPRDDRRQGDGAEVGHLRIGPHQLQHDRREPERRADDDGDGVAPSRRHGEHEHEADHLDHRRQRTEDGHHQRQRHGPAAPPVERRARGETDDELDDHLVTGRLGLLDDDGEEGERRAPSRARRRRGRSDGGADVSHSPHRPEGRAPRLQRRRARHRRPSTWVDVPIAVGRSILDRRASPPAP